MRRSLASQPGSDLVMKIQMNARTVSSRSVPAQISACYRLLDSSRRRGCASGWVPLTRQVEPPVREALSGRIVHGFDDEFRKRFVLDFEVAAGVPTSGLL
jgi:hypothetical protein